MPLRPNDLLDKVAPLVPLENAMAPRPTWADAAQYNANAYGDFVERQNALPPQSWADIAGMYANGLLMGSTAPGMRGLKTPFDFRAEAGRALPRDNYLKSLDAHASTMFREEAPDELVRLLSGQGIPFGRDEKFLADNLDIALGQGQNKGGIQLAFDASKIQGQVNRSKPAWDLGYQSGTAEYLGKDTTQNFRDALTGIRVPDALNLPKTTAARVSRGLQDLEAKGWTKRALDNGYTEYLPPSTGAPK